jgi:hypothetical protein
MNHNPHPEPFDESALDSPEYRERLMRKLNCLIAVLEVATARIKKSIHDPAADVERLARIQGNLQNTLEVCLRARSALERREALPADLPGNLTQVIEDGHSLQSGFSKPAMPPVQRGAMAELNPAQKQRLTALGPIRPTEIRAVDFDELSRRLQGF